MRRELRGSLLPGLLLLSLMAACQELKTVPMEQGKNQDTSDVDPENELGLIPGHAWSKDSGRVLSATATPIAWGDEESPGDEETRRLVKHIPRLHYPRDGRWPILIWAHPAKAGAELQAWIDRGLSPLYNYNIMESLDVWKQMQQQDVPVIFLLQGHVQRLVHRKKDKNVVPVADRPHDQSCPALLLDQRKLVGERNHIAKLYEGLRENGIDVKAVFIDFESGPYLRNGKEKEASVRAEMLEAQKCPQCLKLYGMDKLTSIQQFRSICDGARAEAVKISCTEPLRKVFPEANVGNFFAWPLDRYMDGNGVLNPAHYDVSGGAFPAYGYEGSGMNILQPRCYYVPGWQAYGMPDLVQKKHLVDWNVFTYSLRRFSAAAKVMQPGEKLVPWVGWLFGRARKDGSGSTGTADGYKETIIHTLLRGAETVAIFVPESLSDDFSEPEGMAIDRSEMGVFLRNVVDVQAAYDEVLRFQPFLKTAAPLNHHHEGIYNQPGAEWSGYGNGQAALVRTVSFGRETEKALWLYGNAVALPFREKGAWFWVFPDGSIEEVK